MTTRTLEEWVNKSHRILGLNENQFLIYDFQSLGKLEYQLSQEWEKIKDNLNDTDSIVAFDNHSTLSRLWVIAGYEFLRQVNLSDKRTEIKKAHELFRRVRVPMVKYQPPDSRGGVPYSNDYGTAHLSLSQDLKEVGWSVAPGVFISRNELANILYNLY